MQFHFEGPPAMEAVSITATETGLDIQPLTVRGQHVVRMGYVTATGKNGMSAKAVVLFNCNTGDFTIQRLDQEPVAFAFDKSPTEFQARRDAARTAALQGKEPKRKTADKPEGGTPPVKPEGSNA